VAQLNGWNEFISDLKAASPRPDAGNAVEGNQLVNLCHHLIPAHLAD